jgi:hypothetical protein
MDLLEEARAAVARGEADRAHELITKAFEADPADARVRELYTALHLGRAVRLAAHAREARRRDIVARGIGHEEEFEDSPVVARAFHEALAAVDVVLNADPGHEKALMLKAVLLFRRDRASGRPAALEVLERLQSESPGNRQVAYTISKIARACARCADSGFCLVCGGRGTRRLLGVERRCMTCHGQGICHVCGVV